MHLISISILLEMLVRFWFNHFRQQNQQMCTLNTVCEIIQVKPNHLKKKTKKKTTAHIIVQNFADSVVLGFLVIPVYSMATPYCDEACAAYSRCMQLSSYVEPEITSLVPHAAWHRLPCVVIVTKLGGSLETRLLIQYSL